MDKASSLLFSGIHFDRKRFAADISRFQHKAKAEEEEKSDELEVEALRALEPVKSKKEKKRKRKAKGSETVERFSVFQGSDAPVAGAAVVEDEEMDAASQRKEVEKQIKKENKRRSKQLKAEKVNSKTRFESVCDWIVTKGDNPLLHTGCRGRARINPVPPAGDNPDPKPVVNAIGGKYTSLMKVPEDTAYLDEIAFGGRTHSNLLVSMC